jgi:hypothetical protein
MWTDLLDGDFDVYAQRVDSSGFLLWGADGISVIEATGDQIGHGIVADGMGGAIVVWQDSDTEPGDVYAQRLDAFGATQWLSEGVCLCVDTAGQGTPKITPDGAGGAIVAWFDRRGGSSAQDIYAQRVNALGEIQWTNQGIPVCTYSSMQVFPDIVSDGSGGAIVIWEDYRNGSAHTYAQRIDGSGNPTWTPEGILVSTRPESHYAPGIAADGLGGAVICWGDGSGEIYAQRVDSAGAAMWTPDGVSVNLGPTGRPGYPPSIASDDAGGAFVVWDRWMSDPTSLYDIYVQRLGSTGDFRWALGGVPVCMEASTQDKPTVVSDPLGGVIVVWRDLRNGEPDIYAQRLDSLGSSQWPDSGLAVSTATGTQEGQHVLLVDSCDVIIAWSDERNGHSNWDVYAQNVNCDGSLGITAVAEGRASLPANRFLSQVYPNPFQESARISYIIPTASHVKVEISDLAGRLVETLVNETQQPGIHQVRWNRKDNPSGVYFYQLRAREFVETRKMVVVE